MPSCTNMPEPAHLALLVVLLACAGCSASSEGGSFEVSRVETSWANGRLSVDYEQRLRLSPEARNALVHGVPLTVEVTLVLRNTTDRTRVGSNTKSYEIRYLPLSEHYQVSEAGENKVRTFPRLRHVLSDLARLEISFETGALPAGEYELLARCHLDRQRIPPPMRLPTLFSPNWDLDSSWTSWPLKIDPGA